MIPDHEASSSNPPIDLSRCTLSQYFGLPILDMFSLFGDLASCLMYRRPYADLRDAVSAPSHVDSDEGTIRDNPQVFATGLTALYTAQTGIAIEYSTLLT